MLSWPLISVFLEENVHTRRRAVRPIGWTTGKAVARAQGWGLKLILSCPAHSRGAPHWKGMHRDMLLLQIGTPGCASQCMNSTSPRLEAGDGMARWDLGLVYMNEDHRP